MINQTISQITNCFKTGSKSIITIVISLLLTSGCSYFNETNFENSLGSDVNLIDYSYDIADDLVANAFPPLIPRQMGMAVLTTTFVDNNDLSHTSHFGRLLQEHIGSRFVQQGYTVRELKLRKQLLIQEKSGETILSRQINLIKNTQSAQSILIGTISHAQRTMYISARLVNPIDGTIVSSKNYRLYMDKNVLAMYNLKSVNNKDDFIAPPGEPLMNSILY